MESEQTSAPRDYAKRAGLVAGLAFALLTSQVGGLSVISENPAIGGIQEVLMILIMPGLFGAMILSGNVHSFFPGAAEVINGLFYSVVGWIGYRLVSRIRGRAAR